MTVPRFQACRWSAKTGVRANRPLRRCYCVPRVHWYGATTGGMSCPTCDARGGMSPATRVRMVATAEDPERGVRPSPRCGARSRRMPPGAYS